MPQVWETHDHPEGRMYNLRHPEKDNGEMLMFRRSREDRELHLEMLKDLAKIKAIIMGEYYDC